MYQDSPSALIPLSGAAAPESRTPLTLADVIAGLLADPTLSAARRRDMVSAIRATARMLDLDPAAVPADPRELRQRMQHLSPASGGVSPSRWGNVRSLLLAALKHAGVRVLPGRAPAPLAPSWDTLRSRLPDRSLRYGLSRFMSFCSAQGIAPEAVTAATFAAFETTLDADSLNRAPGAAVRRTCALWNRAVATVPGWPDVRAAVPGNRRRYALAWADFPDSFTADAHAFLHRLGNQDPFADDYAVSVKPSTVAMRRKQILQIATALVRAGMPAAAITDLAVLVQLPNAKRALRFFLDRAGGKNTKYLHQQAQLLKTIARHWVKADNAHVEALKETCRRLTVKHTGMTEKNRQRLRQFDNPDNVHALLNLTRRVLDELAKEDDGKRRTALRAMHAIAVGLLVAAPIRADNLTELRLDRHLVRVKAGRSTMLHLVIPAEETKNGAPYELEVPAVTAALLATYLARYHARIGNGSSPWLFPNETGSRRSTTSFTKGICDFVLREIGIKMNVHLFRHAAIKVYLAAHPEGIDTARRLLGHKSVATTLRAYAETRTAAAFRRYDDVISKLRDQPAAPGRHRTTATGGRT